MQKINFLLIILTLNILYSCDPATHGTVYFKNHSSEKISIHYKKNYGNTDTTVEVNPNETIELLTFGHLQDPSTFDCCPCELDSVTISAIDSSKQILKSITDKQNWQADKTNVKKWKNHEVNCYFEITNSDIH